MKQQPSEGMPWAHVTVYQPPKGPVIVNVYGFSSYGKARTSALRCQREAIRKGVTLIANRVRPVLAFAKDGTLIEWEGNS